MKMVSATTTVTDNSTSVTINIPAKLDIQPNNKALEVYLTDAILDYVEKQHDAKLRDELQNDEEFHALNKELDIVLWSL